MANGPGDRLKIGSMPAANALTSGPLVNTVAALDYKSLQ